VTLLTEEDLRATMGTPHDARAAGRPRTLPLGDYFRSIPARDLEGHDPTTFEVERVYRDPTHRWIHVMLNPGLVNVYLVIVVDDRDRQIVGHRLLDLGREYGLDSSPPDSPLG